MSNVYTVEPIVFGSRAKRKRYEKGMEAVLAAPYSIAIKNNGTELRSVSVFDKEYSDPNISIVSQVPDTSYSEMCMAFVNKACIGMMLVTVMAPNPITDEETILDHLKFDFKRKDGRGNSAISPFNLNDEDDNPGPDKIYQPVFFQVVDIEMDILTYINFKLPPGAEIILNLYQKRGN